jgi:ArsR family transcriptional regulator, arsenate/arsenite/antimonite-responsive transcriptional repressor
MGITKTTYFNTEQNEMASMLKAMSHPARIAIIQHLIKVEFCNCNDLVKELPLAQATISQHLNELKIAKIINGKIEGKSIIYGLSKDKFAILGRYFMGISLKITN